MKKLLLILLCIIFIHSNAAIAENTGEISNEAAQAVKEAEVNNSANEPQFVEMEPCRDTIEVYSEGKYFGLKNKTTGETITEAKYLKLIPVGVSGWIVQKGRKYGMISYTGKELLPTKYRHVERLLGRYVKIGNDSNFGIYNQYGEEIIPPIYNSIDLLYGKMFLTYKNFRYGVSDFKGNVLIPNICDDIYMPSKDVIKIKYLGVWYEITDVSAEKLSFSDTLTNITKTNEFKVTDIVADTGAISGYSILTFSDYMIKVFSSISPAHEETIDDLILSHGVDTVDIIKKFTWVPKYPVTFAKKYYVHVRNPFNGPLADLRSGLKRNIR